MKKNYKTVPTIYILTKNLKRIKPTKNLDTKIYHIKIVSRDKLSIQCFFLQIRNKKNKTDIKESRHQNQAFDWAWVKSKHGVVFFVLFF